MIKLLSTDFDGTLVNHFEQPPIVPDLIALLGNLRRAGIYWAINTGRDLGHIVHGLDEFAFPVDGSHMGIGTSDARRPTTISLPRRSRCWTAFSISWRGRRARRQSGINRGRWGWLRKTKRRWIESLLLSNRHAKKCRYLRSNAILATSGSAMRIIRRGRCWGN